MRGLPKDFRIGGISHQWVKISIDGRLAKKRRLNKLQNLNLFPSPWGRENAHFRLAVETLKSVFGHFRTPDLECLPITAIMTPIVKIDNICNTEVTNEKQLDI